MAALALARRFAQGATMWTIAPDWPEHAHHVAVEFVHPVMVGKRALPAVAVGPAGGADRLHSMVRDGDVVLAIGAAAQPLIADIVRRAPSWGTTTVWLGAGRRPTAGPPDHLLWLDDAGALARHDGSMVFTYHVLWELVHVCFEHPGLLTEPAAAANSD